MTRPGAGVGPPVAVELQGATKVFGAGRAHAVAALQDVSLSIRDNEFFRLTQTIQRHPSDKRKARPTEPVTTITS